jgi:ComF family protein
LAHLNPYAHCSDCLTKEPAFDFAWCACLYDDPLKSLIHQFKYNQGTFLRHLFHHVIISFIKTYHLDTQQFDFIVPIPLHPTRYRERGYNQAELLAGALARTLTIPLKRCLIRWRYTPSQALLAQKERWTNISGAFKINGHNNIRGKAILLVDDLLTTGATVNEAASTLKEAGARRVGVLTLAITPLRSTRE